MENIILIIYTHMQFHTYKISTQAFDPSAIFLLILVSHRVIQQNDHRSWSRKLFFKIFFLKLQITCKMQCSAPTCYK